MKWGNVAGNKPYMTEIHDLQTTSTVSLISTYSVHSATNTKHNDTEREDFAKKTDKVRCEELIPV